MSFIRSFTEKDIPLVAALFDKVYLAGDPAYNKSSLRDVGAVFNEIFFRNPWYDENMPSLVCEARDGAIVGFIGVTPRRMIMKGRSILAAVSAHLMLDPDRRGELAGVRLLQKFLSGPQELSIADFANDTGRRVWGGIGGMTSHVHSLQWVKLLRPSARALSLASSKFRALPRFSSITRPLGRMSDAVLARMAPHRFRFSPPNLIATELDDETLLACISRSSGIYSLCPEYDKPSLSWLIRRAEKIKLRGELRKAALRNDSGAVVGWYLYYLKPGGSSDVLQMGSRKESTCAVLDHLFHHAWSNGSESITGRSEPRLLPALSDKECYLNCGPPWVMVHTCNPGILRAIDRGDAFLSRLEGEWCTSYRI
ncbi:MAG: N-acetyltransferase family protein [Blastocatellales bacterium]